MTRKEWIGELFGYAVIAVFAFGWIDIGQGPEYTWWNLLTLGG